MFTKLYIRVIAGEIIMILIRLRLPGLNNVLLHRMALPSYQKYMTSHGQPVCLKHLPASLLMLPMNMIRRTVKLDVDAEGYVSNLKYFVEKGEFGTAEDSKGNVYIADGEIYVYDASGKIYKGN